MDILRTVLDDENGAEKVRTFFFLVWKILMHNADGSAVEPILPMRALRSVNLPGPREPDSRVI